MSTTFIKVAFAESTALIGLGVAPGGPR